MGKNFWTTWPLATAIVFSPQLVMVEQPVPTPAASPTTPAATAVAPVTAPTSAASIPAATNNAATAASSVAAVAPVEPSQIASEPSKPKQRQSANAFQRSGICSHLDDLAAKYQLPPLFFARLIWQESRFNPDAVSPAGAQGIAQFMPGTAAIWGLDDPFDPGEALLKSAQLLSHLKRKLGNLGFAAAGYNAGSQRVVDWLAGSGYMPLETRNYVHIITGHTIEEWADGSATFEGVMLPRKLPASSCEQLSIALKRPRSSSINVSYSPNEVVRRGRAGKSGVSLHQITYAQPKFTPPPPWGVQLAGSFSRGVAMKQFNTLKAKYGKIIGTNRIVMKSSPQEGRGSRTFHRVRVGTNSRAEADALCHKLQSAGGSCVVMKN